VSKIASTRQRSQQLDGRFSETDLDSTWCQCRRKMDLRVQIGLEAMMHAVNSSINVGVKEAGFSKM